MKTYHKCLVTITESGNSLIIKSEPSLVIPDEKALEEKRKEKDLQAGTLFGNEM